MLTLLSVLLNIHLLFTSHGFLQSPYSFLVWSRWTISCLMLDFGYLADVCYSAVVQAFLLIFFSELGDKTFFIAVSTDYLWIAFCSNWHCLYYYILFNIFPSCVSARTCCLLFPEEYALCVMHFKICFSIQYSMVQDSKEATCDRKKVIEPSISKCWLHRKTNP